MVDESWKGDIISHTGKDPYNVAITMGNKCSHLCTTLGLRLSQQTSLAELRWW